MELTHIHRAIDATRASAPDTRPLLSVVLPAHDEAGVIGGTLQRIARVAPELDGAIETIVVSDGSADNTFDQAVASLDPGSPGTVIELATNVGSHAAIRCGLRYATGDYVAIMSADGQDPPEVLPAMVRELRSRVDVAWGRRRDRDNDRSGARRSAGAYYRLFRVLTGLDYPPGGLDFLVARRRVIEAVLECSSRNTSLHLLIYNLGFPQSFIEYERGPRGGGQSSWTLRKRLKLAVDMLTGVSAGPIRIAALIGLGACLAGIALGGASVLRAAIGDSQVPGWASLMVLGSIASGSMLVAIWLLGEYVWRILDEVRGVPPFIEARHEHVSAAPGLAPLELQ